MKIQLAYGVTRFANTTGLKGDSSGGTDITALLRQAYPAYFVPQSLMGNDAEFQYFGGGDNTGRAADMPLQITRTQQILSNKTSRRAKTPIDFDGCMYSAAKQLHC